MVQRNRQPNYSPVGEVALCRQRVGQWVACQDADRRYGQRIGTIRIPPAARVLVWTDNDNTYLKRQSNQKSGVWVTINEGRDTAVASVHSSTARFT